MYKYVDKFVQRKRNPWFFVFLLVDNLICFAELPFDLLITSQKRA